MKKNIVGLKQTSRGEIKTVVDKKNKISAPEKFWKQLVKVWFDVYKELLPKVEGNDAIPSFVGAELRHMKSLVKELRERAEKNNVVWNEENAKKRWEAFLRKSYEDDFVSKNFMLRIISNNRTKIFNNQITQKNGNNNWRGAGKLRPHTEIKPTGDFGEL